MSDEQELFQIVRRQHVWSSVVDQIRELIDSGRLKPGDRLPSERQLCTQLGISRVSVREALRVLESVGYVEVRSGSGAYVREVPGVGRIPLHDWLREHDGLVERLFELRELAGPGLASMVAEEPDETIIPALRATIEEMADAADADDLLRAIAADAEFHYLLGSRTCLRSRRRLVHCR